MNDRGTSPFSLMFCFVAGGVAGASVALLLAPQSGRFTRDRVRRELSQATGSARHFKDQLIRRGQKVRDEARQRAAGAVSAHTGDGGAKVHG